MSSEQAGHFLFCGLRIAFLTVGSCRKSREDVAFSFGKMGQALHFAALEFASWRLKDLANGGILAII